MLADSSGRDTIGRWRRPPDGVDEPAQNPRTTAPGSHPQGPDPEFAGGPADRLFAVVYEELHGVAKRFMSDERSDHTLQPTALVHEAYLKLTSRGEPDGWSREQFLGLAGQAMRYVLVDHARAKRSHKRGGTSERVLLDEALEIYEERALDLLLLDDSLDELAKIDPQLARIVECRFFAGLTTSETAQALSTPQRTVERGWATARAWLRRHMGRSG